MPFQGFHFGIHVFSDRIIFSEIILENSVEISLVY